MIVWLASYPKSGNTWVRVFLSSLLFSKDQTKEIDINKNHITQFPLKSQFTNLVEDFLSMDQITSNCLLAQERINLDNKIKFFKTHSALWKNQNTGQTFTDKDNTLGVIHIVRDPRNIITSVMHYFNKKSYEETLEFLQDTNNILGGNKHDNGIPTLLSSWSNHYNSWKSIKKNYLLIKYENLILNPENEFTKITKYLSSIGDFTFNKKRVLETIKNCNFENFVNQENKFGFKDNSATLRNLKKKFFRLGPKNNWRDLLDIKIREKIELSFKKEMKELGYL